MTGPHDEWTIRPSRHVNGVVRVPGDKSISHRAAMLSALSAGESRIEGFLTAEDCLHTLAAARALGAEVERDGASVRVHGTGGRFHAPSGVLDMGNSGTGIRLLSGFLAAHPFVSELTGDESLRSRPMRRIQEPLERMGARIGLSGAKGCAPLRITGGRLNGIRYEMPVASAQVKSCVLLAGLFASGHTSVIEPKPTRDHTERMLRALGLPLKAEGREVSVTGSDGAPLRLAAHAWRVPGDFSSAAFWLAAAAMRAGSCVRVGLVGLNPRRTALLDVLRRMGADVKVETEDDGWEPAGSVEVRGGGLRGTTVEGAEIPNLIDELPAVAVAAAMAEGETLIRDASELRVKESDRIAAMANGLRAFGVGVETFDDGLRIEGTGGQLPELAGVVVDSLGDHRIAMAFAVLALCGRQPVRILRTEFVKTSYPSFRDDLLRTAGV